VAPETDSSLAGPARSRPRSLLPAVLGTYGTNAGASALSLVNVLIIARALGPSGRGQVALLIAIATLSSHFASLSLQEANGNLGSRLTELRPTLVTNSILFAIGLGLAAALIVQGLVWAVPSIGGHVGTTLLWISLGSIPILLLKQYLQYLLQSDYRFSVTNAAWLAGPCTTFTTNVALVAFGQVHVVTAIAAWVGGQTLGTLIMVVYAGRRFGFGRPRRSVAWDSACFGAKAYVGRLMEVGNYRMDQWLTGAMVGPKELGLYSIAVAWAEMLYYLPGVIVLVARPDLVRSTLEQAVAKTASLFRRVAFLALATSLALIVAAPFLCTTVFGPRFHGSIADLRILALGAVGISGLELIKTALTAQRKPMVGSAAVGAAFVVTLVLDLALIPSHGGIGASIATSVAYTAGAAFASVLFVRTLGGRLADLVPGLDDVRWFWRRGVQIPHLAIAAVRGRG
jgi:O-antigen/teichoic acid export membrane protein